MRFIYLYLIGLSFFFGTSAQFELENTSSLKDTTSRDTIVFTPSSAMDYIQNLVERDSLFRPGAGDVKYSLERLLYFSREPFDSVGKRLSAFPYDSIQFREIEYVKKDSIPLMWLNDSTFIFNPKNLNRESFLVRQTIIENEKHLDILFRDSLPSTDVMMDSIFLEPDTITKVYIDSLFLDSMEIQMFEFRNQEVRPPLLTSQKKKSVRISEDSAFVIYADTIRTIVGSPDSPFYKVPNFKVADSLKIAVWELLNYTSERDSIPLFINDLDGNETPLWLGSGDDDFFRYWVKNYKDDSITIWVGNPSKNTITVFLEEEVNINRLTKHEAHDIPITLAEPETSLADLVPLKNIPVLWNYGFSSSMAFSQTYLSNWAKGGESSLTTLLDIKGEANFKSDNSKSKWNNNGRLKYGSILSGEYGMRKNTDMIEFNSQYNKLIKGEFDFSTVFYMKNQLAKGYNYPNDSVVVSRFLNPVTFTIGAGVEYKPFKHTLLNFSPLSYKNTFVLDTAEIDQTAHGIDADKRVKQEMGGQLLIKNKLNILDGLEIENSVRLFNNYFDRPVTVDMDWEINLRKRITWFFTISANIHMIYDNDIRFPVLDENDVPIKLPDGSVKKEPKLQFMEFVGLSFALSL